MKTYSLTVAALVVVALTGLTGCGSSTPTVSQSELEKKISQGLEKEVGQAPDDVSCPGDLEGEVGDHDALHR